MFNYSILQQYFLGKVGFSQTKNPCIPKIHPTLLSNQIVVNGVANELLKNETIYDCVGELSVEPEKIAKIPIWSNLTNYFIGDIVKHTIGLDTFIYVALQNNINQFPIWNSLYWETNLSSYLRFQHNNGVAECLAITVTESNNEKILPTAISFHTVFERFTKSQPDIYLPTNFVGVQVSLAKMRNLQFTVNQIGLQVSQAQSIRFYVYAQSNNVALTYFDVIISAGDINNFVWKDVLDILTNAPLVLSYFADKSDVGGLYYIGFFRDDVLGDINIWDTSYRNFICSNGSFLRPIIAEFSNKPNLPEVGYYGWETTDNFYTSFNLKVSTAIDFTVNVQQAPQQFYKAIQYQIACNLLKECASSSRINRNQANLENKFSQILKGYEVVKRGYTTTEGGLLSDLVELKNNLKINLNYMGGSPLTNNFG